MKNITRLFVLALALVSFVSGASARFVGVDPEPVDPSNVHSFNRYAYANNNPYRFVDPDGRAPEEANLPIGVSRAEQRQVNRLAGGIAVEGATFILAPVAIEAGIGAALTATGLGARVAAIHAILDPIAASRRTTAGLDTIEGTRIIASGARDLTPAQRAAMAPGEVAAKSPGVHAEVTALEHAAKNSLTPKDMAVSRPICDGCKAAIEQSGGTVTSPTTATWPR